MANHRRRTPDMRRSGWLGDRAHTRRVAGRLSLVIGIATLMVLLPLAYGLVRAGSGRTGQFGLTDGVLVALVVVVIAAGAGFAAYVAVHLLGHEARARRERQGL